MRSHKRFLRINLWLLENSRRLIYTSVEAADTSVALEAVNTSVAVVTLKTADTFKAVGLLEDV